MGSGRQRTLRCRSFSLPKKSAGRQKPLKLTILMVLAPSDDHKSRCPRRNNAFCSLRQAPLSVSVYADRGAFLVYTDGGCSTNFEVKQAATPTGGKDTTGPPTGDNSSLLLWAALLFESGFGQWLTAEKIEQDGIKGMHLAHSQKSLLFDADRTGGIAYVAYPVLSYSSFLVCVNSGQECRFGWASLRRFFRACGGSPSVGRYRQSRYRTGSPSAHRIPAWNTARRPARKTPAAAGQILRRTAPPVP